MENQNKTTRMRKLYSLKCYIQGASRKKQYQYFFRRASKISRKICTYALWDNSGKLKEKKLESGDTLIFKNAIYRVLHERSNIAAYCFFCGARTQPAQRRRKNVLFLFSKTS